MIYLDAQRAAERFAPIFEKMGWTWRGKDGNHYVPLEAQICQRLIQLRSDIISDDCLMSGTGRLEAVKMDKERICFRLDPGSESEWDKQYAG